MKTEFFYKILNIDARSSTFIPVEELIRLKMKKDFSCYDYFILIQFLSHENPVFGLREKLMQYDIIDDKPVKVFLRHIDRLIRKKLLIENIDGSIQILPSLIYDRINDPEGLMQKAH